MNCDYGRGIRPFERTVALGVVLAIGAIFLGCLSPDTPLSEAALAELARGQPACGELTYENFAASFLATYCLRCHTAALATDFERRDAPQGINYDSLEEIRQFARRIRVRAGELGDMPPRLLPVPRPSEAERVQLIRWLDCGTPSEAELPER